VILLFGGQGVRADMRRRSSQAQVDCAAMPAGRRALICYIGLDRIERQKSERSESLREAQQRNEARG
jgi:hypothetical protein